MTKKVKKKVILSSESCDYVSNCLTTKTDLFKQKFYQMFCFGTSWDFGMKFCDFVKFDFMTKIHF